MSWFGMPVPEGAVAAWGARTILVNNRDGQYIDIVHDRAHGRTDAAAAANSRATPARGGSVAAAARGDGATALIDIVELLAGIHTRMTAIEGNSGSLLVVLGRVNVSLAAVNSRLDRLERRLDFIERALQRGAER